MIRSERTGRPPVGAAYDKEQELWGGGSLSLLLWFPLDHASAPKKLPYLLTYFFFNQPFNFGEGGRNDWYALHLHLKVGSVLRRLVMSNSLQLHGL